MMMVVTDPLHDNDGEQDFKVHIPPFPSSMQTHIHPPSPHPPTFTPLPFSGGGLAPWVAEQLRLGESWWWRAGGCGCMWAGGSKRWTVKGRPVRLCVRKLWVHAWDG